MVFTNAFFFYLIIVNIDYGMRLWDFRYPSKEDISPKTLYGIRMAYFYWISKFIDLIDTFLFALRKKYSHITFLHLYHHTIVPIFGWMLLRINPLIPVVGFFALCNTFIHVVMYSYYGLAAFGPQIQKYLWWKKYITKMQLYQFILYAIYACIVVCKQIDYPIFWVNFVFTQPPFFFYMFYDFYQRSYNKPKCYKSQ